MKSKLKKFTYLTVKYEIETLEKKSGKKYPNGGCLDRLKNAFLLVFDDSEVSIIC